MARASAAKRPGSCSGRPDRARRLLRCAALACACSLASSPASSGEKDWRDLRERMVETQIEARGVRDPRVLGALRRVPRHLFVPEALREHAYEDRPLPIGQRQTISQPYVVAAMTEAIRAQVGDRVLEIGTGSGYQAALLSLLVAEVYSIEIVEPLALAARARLRELHYENVHVVTGDGYRGLPEHAPFDAIVVTAAPGQVPQPLLEQLAEGGRMVIPVGEGFQELEVLEKTPTGIRRQVLFPVRFVPMTGEVQGVR